MSLTVTVSAMWLPGVAAALLVAGSEVAGAVVVTISGGVDTAVGGLGVVGCSVVGAGTATEVGGEPAPAELQAVDALSAATTSANQILLLGLRCRAKVPAAGESLWGPIPLSYP
ncbi:hypothetical protein ACFVVC_01705 [Pseudarthrobacter sp. NPDC058196]|uniref:hypothetical protein n=1 Tax=Pseudarthrobacter sp. NPDC058196 TaxID=3346376 RepID=UPI0036DBFBD0